MKEGEKETDSSLDKRNIWISKKTNDPSSFVFWFDWDNSQNEFVMITNKRPVDIKPKKKI